MVVSFVNVLSAAVSLMTEGKQAGRVRSGGASPQSGERGREAGDGAAAARLYRTHRQRIYHLCLRYGGGNAAWAEDVTQDVFIRLLEHLDTLDSHDDLGGWVYRVATNTCLTRLKREGSIWSRVRQALVDRSTTAVTRTPERTTQVRRDLRAVQEQLDRLPAKERVVFCMRYLDELPQQRIAEILSLSKGYVSKLLARARERLGASGWEVSCD